MSKQGFIYKYIYPNGKVYIGQTRVSVRDRHYQHMSASKDPKRRTICEVAIAKYGEPKLETIETIEVADNESTKLVSLLNEAEKKWITEYDSTNRIKGYNIQNGGEMITPEEFILQEKWYEIYEKDEWGYLLGYYTELLKNIGHKLCITHEKLTKEESSCWYGYKFMDYNLGKETTFNSFYKRNKAKPFLCDISDVDYAILEKLNVSNATQEELNIANAQQEEIFYNQIIKNAIEEHWIKDIQQTIWKQIIKKKDKIIKDYFKK